MKPDKLIQVEAACCLYLTARVVGDTSPSFSPPFFREAVKDVIENRRELDQAVTYLHEIGV